MSEETRTDILIKLNELAILYVKDGNFIACPTVNYWPVLFIMILLLSREGEGGMYFLRFVRWKEAFNICMPLSWIVDNRFLTYLKWLIHYYLILLLLSLCSFVGIAKGFSCFEQ